jgi:hypothetical protein
MEPAPDFTVVSTTHHRSLIALAAETRSGNVQAVLNLGAAVLLHGLLEPTHLGAILRLVDPTVRFELQQEHAGLESDLALLAELNRSGDATEDSEALAGALLVRLRNHVQRDERTLYRPLGRLQQLPRSGSQEESQ